MTIEDILKSPSFFAVLAIIFVIASAVSYKAWLMLLGVRLVPDDSIAVVYKKYVLTGKNRELPAGSVVALNGEAGLQADTLPPGVHYGFWFWQYRLEMAKFTVVPTGKIGVVVSADGQATSPGRVLGTAVSCDSFQDARKFLTSGGCRGPQIATLPPGSWRINPGLFTVQLAAAVDIPDNQIGIVTVKDGTELPAGDIAGPEIAGHNSFQDGEAFIKAHGLKGLQEQVLKAGRYYINPLFAAVSMTDLQTVPIANVGVIIAYVGKPGVDVSGDSFKHGNLVGRGERGVWADPLDPGRYPINPFTHKMEIVPTANVVLNWADTKSESHKLDENLSTITVRSSDGFTYNLDVSQIIHIPRNEAPKVIGRFGNMLNLVTQVLEPTIGNYFRNSTQSYDVISFLKNRKERQNEARTAIQQALAEYNVIGVDTLIGDIVPPADLMKTLTDRKIAQQQKETFDTQKLAEETRKELQQAKAQADTQASVVTAERQVEIKRFEASAAVEQAKGASEAVRLNGVAEAGRTLAVGEAEAAVIQKKTDALSSGNYAGIEIAKALATSGKLVPDIVTGGGQGGIIDALLALTLKQGGLPGNGHSVNAVVVTEDEKS